MNLARLLEINQVNRNSFNTLARRAGLAFMHDASAPSIGHDRYNFAQCVALACVRWMGEAGGPLPAASKIVTGSYNAIREISELAINDDEVLGWVNAYLLTDGTWEGHSLLTDRSTYYGSRDQYHGVQPAGEVMGAIFIPVHKIARALAKKVREIGLEAELPIREPDEF